MSLTAAFGQETDRPAFLDLGSKVLAYPKVQWLKGQPVAQFEKDKVYVIELWATWCLPCLEAMPHLNEMAKKYKDKNVIFIAQDVMEDDQAKVEAFVKKQGEAMSFPVAYGGGTNSDFYLKWTKPAGVFEIPQTFVIQNNTIIWQTNPHYINEQTLDLILQGKFTIDAAEEIIKKANH